MTIHLALRTDDTNRLTVSLDGQPLADSTSLTDLPALSALQATAHTQTDRGGLAAIMAYPQMWDAGDTPAWSTPLIRVEPLLRYRVLCGKE